MARQLFSAPQLTALVLSCQELGVNYPPLEVAMNPSFRSLSLALGSGQYARSTVRQKISASDQQRLDEVLARVKLLLQTLHDADKAIDADKHLSEAGKTDRRVKAMKKTRGELKFLADEVVGLTADITRRNNELFEVPAVSKEDRVPDLLAQQEHRSIMRGKPYAEIILAYERALNTGNDVLRRALVLAPEGSLVQPKDRKRLEIEHASTTMKADYQRLEELEVLHETLNTVLGHVEQALEGKVGHEG